MKERIRLTSDVLGEMLIADDHDPKATVLSILTFAVGDAVTRIASMLESGETNDGEDQVLCRFTVDYFQERVSGDEHCHSVSEIPLKPTEETLNILYDSIEHHNIMMARFGLATSYIVGESFIEFIVKGVDEAGGDLTEEELAESTD